MLGEVVVLLVCEAEQKLNMSTQAIVKLCKLIISINGNVTADNWFGSIRVVDGATAEKAYVRWHLKNDKKAKVISLKS